MVVSKTLYLIAPIDDSLALYVAPSVVCKMVFANVANRFSQISNFF